jgi:hypothetical protein
MRPSLALSSHWYRYEYKCATAGSAYCVTFPVVTKYRRDRCRLFRHISSRNMIPLNIYIYIRCSLCRLIRLLSTWCRAAAFFSASAAALSQEVPTVKWMSNQPALWTPDIYGMDVWKMSRYPSCKKKKKEGSVRWLNKFPLMLQHFKFR